MSRVQWNTVTKSDNKISLISSLSLSVTNLLRRLFLPLSLFRPLFLSLSLPLFLTAFIQRIDVNQKDTADRNTSKIAAVWGTKSRTADAAIITICGEISVTRTNTKENPGREKQDKIIVSSNHFRSVMSERGQSWQFPCVALLRTHKFF